MDEELKKLLIIQYLEHRVAERKAIKDGFTHISSNELGYMAQIRNIFSFYKLDKWFDELMYH